MVIYQCSKKCVQQCLVQAIGEMGDLQDFQKRANHRSLTEASVTLTAQLFGGLTASFYMIMTEYTKHAKTLSVKKNSG